MTAQEIEARLKQLEIEASAHQNRDLDAEVRQALLSGADVDALEASQLEAERLQRRHRVEHQALEQALPVALKREATETLEGMKRAHEGLQRQAVKFKDALQDTGGQWLEQINQFRKIQEQASELTRQAANLSAKTGADMPTMGPFLHGEVAAIALRLREQADMLGRLAGHPLQTRAGLQSTSLD